ncbi:hypothetical protein [uncultured Deinococcus sp.]|uniref:hypothetical protein n=1 Tax=uncultured Deinococcus sp. TaxID=158789 RepID=UPI0025D745CC|nr:hypothetical protein [uncultured Deinococcus sp.]
MTGLQWAVLTAYARVLPACTLCREVHALARHGAPHKSWQAGARTVADPGRLTKGSQITYTGKLPALGVLSRHGIRLDVDAVLSLRADGGA